MSRLIKRVKNNIEELGETELVKQPLSIPEINLNTYPNFKKRIYSTSENLASLTEETNIPIDSVDVKACGIVNGLNSSSIRITNIAEIVKRIAEQTNLLALNSSSEAGYRGESEKRFAVVAQEVLRLTEQSKQAVEEITELVQVIKHLEKIQRK